MSKKQYVIVREGNRTLPREGSPADPMFMMDPEEVRYKEDFLCRKFVILEHVVSFDSNLGHCRTKSGKHYDVTRSHLARPAPG